MISIKVVVPDDTDKEFSELAKRQIPFATSVAINKLATRGKKNVQGTMKQVFDRPTRFTLNALKVTPSDKKQEIIQAMLWFKDPTRASAREHYLVPQVIGGGRQDKTFEWLLKNKGIMASGQKAIPGSGIRLNRFGNVTGGMHTKILSALSAQRDVGFTSHSKGAKAKKYFAIRRKHGKLPPGIYERYGRKGKKIRPAFIFTSKAVRYQPRLPLHQVVQKTIDRHLNDEFDTAFNRAMRTARRPR